MAAHQAPPSLGFSRQEHWSRLAFPSPMRESEKWKWSRSVVSVSVATPWTAAYQAPLSMGFSRQEYWSGFPLPSPESAMCIHISPSSWVSLPPRLWVITEHWVELLVLHSNSPPALSPSPPRHIHRYVLCVSIPAQQIGSSVMFF